MSNEVAGIGRHASAVKPEGMRRQKRPVFLLSFLLSCGIGAAALFFWFRHDPTATFTLHIPGMDGEPPDKNASGAPQGATVQIGAFFKLFDSSSVRDGSAWPRFRGSGYDNINTENTHLRSTWKNSTPQMRWSVDCGEGHAGPAIAHGRVYLLDYDETEEADALRCFSLDDGRELWRRWYGVKVKRNHGRSRTVPAVTDRFCVTIGPRCHVMCVNPITGDLRWGIDLEKEYNTEVPLWYTGQCPLIDDSIAVIAPGGSSLMIGVDCATGKVIWKTPNPDNWKMSHSSITPGHFGGRKVYVYCAVGGIAGIAADGDDRGTLLFASDAFNKSVVAPSPVILDNGRIFVTAGYGAGCMMFRVTNDQNAFRIAVLQQYDVKQGFASEQQTPVYYKKHLYGILPKDAGSLRNQFVCVNPEALDTMTWSSGPQKRYGLGPYLVADNKLFIFNENGELTIAAASPERFIELSTVKLMDGTDAWAPLALSDGILLARDSRKMICIDIGE